MRTWKKVAIAFAAVLALVLATLAYKVNNEFAKAANDDPLIWEPDIAAFEKLDNEAPPPQNAVLFIGSSSIRFWRNLEVQMHPVPVIKRGFGGSRLRSVIHYADRIVLPYRPRAIVLFAGTNDIAGNATDKSPEMLLNDFVEFANLVNTELPGCVLYYLPITPTTKRWAIWPQADRANQLIKKYISGKPALRYIDITNKFLLPNGHPNKDLLWLDGIHLNRKGYEVWAKHIESILIKDLGY